MFLITANDLYVSHHIIYVLTSASCLFVFTGLLLYKMERDWLFFLVALLLSVHCYTILGGSAKTSNINIDQSALLSLKSHITSDPFSSLANNWTSETSVCSWKGVTCDSRHNRVTELDVSDMGLVGTIPPEIGNLSSLVSLEMTGNSFHGHIPLSIFNMSSLEIVSLTNNRLSGSLPMDICSHGRLQRLQVLVLTQNNLYGEIPSSLGQCLQLQVVSLLSNNFTGHVPRQIGNITGLTAVFLGFNSLDGMVLDLLSIMNLKYYII